MFDWLRRMFRDPARENPAVWPHQPAPSYARFTDRARRVMELANREAQQFNHEYIGTEHILLGLVAEGAGVAANVLKARHIDLRKIRLEVEKIVQHGPGGEQVIMGRLPHTPRAKKVIDYSVEEARNLNHNYVGTEHLLLGLLREEEGVAAQILMNMGLDFADARQGVVNLLAQHPRDRVAETEELEAAPVAPAQLTEDEIRLVEERIDRINVEKEQFVLSGDFAAARKRMDEAQALARLLAWYRWHRDQP